MSNYYDYITLQDGQEYEISIYVLNEDKTKSYLTDNCDPKFLKKIHKLIHSLVKAHDEKSVGAGVIKKLDAEGMHRKDRSIVPHDFALSGVNEKIAKKMASLLKLQPEEIKAQDVWNKLDNRICSAIKNQETHLKKEKKKVSDVADIAPPLPLPEPEKRSAAISPPQDAPALQNTAPEPVVKAEPVVKKGLSSTSIDLDLKGVVIGREGWYENLPIRTKYRIVALMADGSSPRGGVYQQVWQYFKNKSDSTNTPVVTLLKQEKSKLEIECSKLPSLILDYKRRQAEEIYWHYMHRHLQFSINQQIKSEIIAFMDQEFFGKKELLQCICEQAQLEGITADIDWVNLHYAEDSFRFIQALARWLDNN